MAPPDYDNCNDYYNHYQITIASQYEFYLFFLWGVSNFINGFFNFGDHLLYHLK